MRLGVFIEHVSKRRVFAKAKGICGICEHPIGDLRKCTLDHIIPLSRGGTHEYSNIQPAHRECNQRKADLLPHQWLGIMQPAIVGHSTKLRYRNNGKKRKRARK